MSATGGYRYAFRATRTSSVRKRPADFGRTPILAPDTVTVRIEPSQLPHRTLRNWAVFRKASGAPNTNHTAKSASGADIST